MFVNRIVGFFHPLLPQAGQGKEDGGGNWLLTKWLADANIWNHKVSDS